MDKKEVIKQIGKNIQNARKEKGYSKSKWAITNGFVEDDDITHWMPIPKFETKDKEDKQ